MSASATTNCGGPATAPAVQLSLPVVAEKRHVRPSKTSRWRAGSLVAVHLLIVGHLIHWRLAGRTLSPVEPSETMYTLNEGHLNAGCVFLIVSLAATLVLGRFVCGWGCHVVAYQDLCAWLLKKVGIHPKPFRSRLLVLAPLALAIYMFVWPTAYRWWVKAPAPPLSNYLMTSEFWKTFPGPGVAVLTIAVCGFAIVYFLGSKGFCTYGCPYGGLFALADRVAPGRIRVTDDCEHCGHCTAVCTSNVRVHEEVAKFGMVVDPGCMKCMDCVSVCPNDALYFGFTAAVAPSHKLEPARPAASERKFDFTLWEELLFAAAGLVAMLAFRGLYGLIPLLLAMGVAAMTGWTTIKVLHLIRTANVRFQNLSLKRGGRLSGAGWGFAAGAAGLFLFTAHSAAVQWNAWRGQRAMATLQIGDEVWVAGNDWWARASAEKRRQVEAAVRSLEWTTEYGLAGTPAVLQDLVWLYLAKARVQDAERTVRQLLENTPETAEPYRGLANILRMTGRNREAEEQYRLALAVDASHARALEELASLLSAQGRVDDAKRELRRLVEGGQAPATTWSTLGLLEIRSGESDVGIQRLGRALELDPQLFQTRYQLAAALLSRADGPGGRAAIDEAITHLRMVISERPQFAEAHYNLGVAEFMSGQFEDALNHVREALRLNPSDVQAKQFLQVVEESYKSSRGD